MKKILCFCLMIMISANVLAFGGGGHGRVSSQYKKGVSSFGIYYGGDGQVDIDIRDCNDETETWTGVCCPNELVYVENEEQKCCNTEGYAIDGIGKCVRTCPVKQVLVNDECVDLCKEYQSKICAQECNWKTGEGIPESSETVCGNNMHCSGEDDRCVCNETFEAKDAGSCECPNKWVKQGDICVNLCANYQETVCKQICDWKTGEGIPVVDGRSCGENKVCDTDGNCVWVACEDENKERDSAGNCVCKNPLTCGDNQKFNEETCECECIETHKWNDEHTICVSKCEGYTDKTGGCQPVCEPTTGEGKAGNDGKLCQNNTGRCENGACKGIACSACEVLNEKGDCIVRTCGINKMCDIEKDDCICDNSFTLSIEPENTIYTYDVCADEVTPFTHYKKIGCMDSTNKILNSDGNCMCKTEIYDITVQPDNMRYEYITCTDSDSNQQVHYHITDCKTGYEWVGEGANRKCVRACDGTGEARHDDDICVCDNANNYYGEVGSCQLCDSTKGEVMNGSDCVCDNANNYYGEVGSCTLCSGTGKIVENNACVCDKQHKWADETEQECVSKCEGEYNTTCQTCNVDANGNVQVMTTLGWFLDKYDECYECSTMSDVDVGENVDSCNACQNTDYKRKLDGDYCVLSCPDGTSIDGEGGVAVPEQCRCNIANTTWNAETRECDCPSGQEYVTLDNGVTSCMNKCRDDQKHDKATDGHCVCKDPSKEDVGDPVYRCMTPCVGDQIRDMNNEPHGCVCPGTGGTLNGEVCCNTDTKFAWNESTSAYDKVLPSICGCPSEFPETNGACALCSTENEPRFVAVDNVCRKCTVDESYRVIEEKDCAVCEASRRRFVSGTNMCVRNNCSDTEFYDMNGNCYSCDIEDDAFKIANNNTFPAIEPNSCYICSGDNKRSMITLSDGTRTCVKPCSGEKFHDWFGTCQACNDTTPYHTDEAENDVCDNFARRFYSQNGVSYSCTHPENVYDTVKDECLSCNINEPMREYDENRQACRPYCVDNFRDTSGVCKSCNLADPVVTAEADDNCANRFYANDGKSYRCDTAAEPATTEDQCNRCEYTDTNGDTQKRRMMVDGKCIYKCEDAADETEQFFGTDKVCHKCSDASNINATVTESDLCKDTDYPRMVYSGTSYLCEGSNNIPAYDEAAKEQCRQNCSATHEVRDSYCMIKCEPGKTYLSNYQSYTGYRCLDCNAYGVAGVYSVADCLSCNVEGEPPIRSNSGYSYYLGGYSWANTCYRIGCEKKGYFQYEKADDGQKGYCVECKSSGVLKPLGSTLAEKSLESQKCNNNDYDSPVWRFLGNDGRSYRCDYASAVSTTLEECALCDDSASPREYNDSDGKCYKPCGTGEGDTNTYFRSADGTCYACNYQYFVTVNGQANSDGNYEGYQCQETETPRFFVLTDTADAKYSSTSRSCTNPGNNGKTMKKECDRCSNLEHLPDDPSDTSDDAMGYCVTKCDHTQGQFYRSTRACVACSDGSYNIIPLNEDECLSCNPEGSNPVRGIFNATENGNGNMYCSKIGCAKDNFQYYSGQCEKCLISTARRMPHLATEAEMKDHIETQCNYEGSNTSNWRFLGTDKKSYLCSHASAVATSEDLCKMCDDSAFPREYNTADGKCYKSCKQGPDDENEYFRGTDGVCYACDYNNYVVVDNPAKVTEKCPNRFGTDAGVVGTSYSGNTPTTKLSLPCNFHDEYFYTFGTTDDQCSYCKDNNNNPIREHVTNSNETYCYKVCADGEFRTATGNSSSGYNRCKSCSDENRYEIYNESDCEERCPGQRKMLQDGTKRYCVKIGCTKTDQFQASNGTCQGCGNSTTYTPMGDDYTARKNEIDTRCNYEGSANKRFVDQDGKSYLCSYENGVNVVDENACNQYCTSRVYVPNTNGNGGKCYLTACADGFRDSSGACHSCGEGANSIDGVLTSETESNRCNNRWYSSAADPIKGTGASYHCSSTNHVKASADQSNRCKNTSTPRLVNQSYTSYKCSYSNDFYDVTLEQCQNCSATHVSIDGHCVKDCVVNSTIHNASRSCVACTDSNPIKVSASLDKPCETYCSATRKMYGEYCALRYCNGSNNNGYFHRSSDGACYQCSANDKIVVSGTEIAECEACGNREVFNGQCVKKCDSGYFHSSDGGCALCSSTDTVVTTADAIIVCQGLRCIDPDTGISTLCE